MTDPTTPSLPVEMIHPAAPAVQRTKNTLTLPQQLKLARWCQDNVSICQVETYSKLAAVAAATLEFTVTPANMSSTIEACEIERKKPDAPPTLEEQVKTLEQQVVNLGILHADMLTSMGLMTKRLERLERIEAEASGRGEPAVVQAHPELGLPVPGFGEAAPFRPEHFPVPAAESPYFPGDSK